MMGWFPVKSLILHTGTCDVVKQQSGVLKQDFIDLLSRVRSQSDCPCSARSCTCCAISLTSDIIYRIENAPHSLVLRGPNLPDAEIASHPSPPHPPAAVSCCCLILFVFAVVIAFDTPVFSAERFASFRFQRLTDVTNAVIVFGF